MTFSGLCPDAQSTSPVPLLNLTQVKFHQKQETVDFEGYSDKLEAQNVHLRQ